LPAADPKRPELWGNERHIRLLLFQVPPTIHATRPANYDEERPNVSIEEAILETVRRLPPAQQEAVLRFAHELQPPPAKIVPLRGRSRETQWIEEHRADYAHQWVSVEGDRLILANHDPLKVFAAAKAAGIESPFVVHVLPEDPLPFVPGW
jgi:hypothetical protein